MDSKDWFTQKSGGRLILAYLQRQADQAVSLNTRFYNARHGLMNVSLYEEDGPYQLSGSHHLII